MFPTINIGPLALQSYGLILLIGLWIGLWLADRLSDPTEISSDILYNSVGISLVAALIGARLVYVMQNFEAFRNDLISILSLNYNLLDPWGAAVTGVLVLIIYLQRSNTQALVYLDTLTPLLATMLIALPLANLAVGSDYGVPVDLPWAINLWGAERHPTQVYQTIFGIGILIWLLITNQNLQNRVPGQVFFDFIALTSLGIILIGAFRAEQNLLFGRFRISQVTAWIVLAISLGASGYLRNSQRAITNTPKLQEG